MLARYAGVMLFTLLSAGAARAGEKCVTNRGFGVCTKEQTSTNGIMVRVKPLRPRNAKDFVVVTAYTVAEGAESGTAYNIVMPDGKTILCVAGGDGSVQCVPQQ
jgi:hypothetical protein